MLVRTAYIALVLVTAACSSKDPGSSAGAAGPEARALACLSYQQNYWRSVADGDDRAVDVDRYACAEVYRHRSCPDAWAELPTSPDDTMLGLASACTRAYCGDLAADPPLLCVRDLVGLSPPDRVPALVQLDRAILLHELGSPELAEQLSARHRIFRVRSIAP